MAISDEIYSGTATFGKIWAVVSALATTFMVVILVIAGVGIIKHRDHLKSDPNGIVTADSVCHTETSSRNEQNTVCSSFVNYTTNDGTKETNKAGTGSEQHKKGDKVTVYYDPATPDKPELQPANKVIGWVLILVAVFLFVIVWGWVYITRKYKMAAAYGGVAELFHLARW